MFVLHCIVDPKIIIAQPYFFVTVTPPAGAARSLEGAVTCTDGNVDWVPGVVRHANRVFSLCLAQVVALSTVSSKLAGKSTRCRAHVTQVLSGTCQLATSTLDVLQPFADGMQINCSSD
jgi:hypothetical protein